MTPVVVSSMLPSTLLERVLAVGRLQLRGPVADLGVHVVEPIEGDEDHGARPGRPRRPSSRAARAPGRRRCACSRCRCPRRGWRRRRCRSPAPGWRPRRPGCESGLEAIRHEVGAAGLEGAGQVGGLGVTCRQADMRRPASGFSLAKRSRMRASTGMSRSAQRMRFLPPAASLGSLMSWRGKRGSRHGDRIPSRKQSLLG